MRKLLLAVLLLPCLAAAQSSNQHPFHWTGTLDPGKTLAIKNVSGNVTVDAASGNRLEVTATKRGYGADRVRIDVIPSSEGIAVCAVYPNSDSSCDASPEWNVQHESHGHDEASVDFVVHMPRDAKLILRDVNGTAKATGLGQVADVTTVNGSVEVSTEQWAHLASVNGSVNGHFGRADWSEPLSIATVNGDITLDVPADLSTDFEFNAVNGSFNTDLPATVQQSSTDHSWGPKHVKGTIGSGGRELKLHTVNGSVSIHKSTM
jgi:Putative adhesin